MRTVALFLLLVMTGYVACHLPLAADAGAEKQTAADSWRRTADGWERNTWDATTRNPPSFSLPHPALLALAEVLVSFTALLACSQRR